MNNWLRKKQARSPAKVSAVGLFFLLLIGYGLYIQTQDFHPKGGFQRHRKVLLDTTDTKLGQNLTEALHDLAQPQLTVEDPNAQRQKHLQQESEQLQSATVQEAKQAGDSLGKQDDRAVEETSTIQTAAVTKPPSVKSLSAEGGFTAGKDPADENKEGATVVEMAEHLEKPNFSVKLSMEDESLQGLVDSAADKAAGQAQSKIRPHLPGSLQQKSQAKFRKLPSFNETKAQYEAKSEARAAPISKGDETAEAVWKERQAVVRKAAVDSWAVYEKYAMGDDELAPLTLTGKSSYSFGGLAATLIDSLDTLWMLGMKEEFARARNWIDKNLTFDKRAKISLFETVIRIIGGLLSAYDLSGDKLFLDKSQELADKLMPSLNTTKTGIPTNLVQFNAAPGEFKKSEIGRAALAEFGSIQVEFLALSRRCSDATYGEKAEALVKVLHDNYPDQGLLPVWFNRKQAKFTGSQLYTVGAMADSYFEYLLKLWLLHQKQAEMYRSMWEKAVDEILDQLVSVSDSGLAFIGQKRNRGMFSGKMEHLACYLPGNMALGAAEGAVGVAKAAYYMDVAANLTHTCFQLYNRTKTGLGLDVVMFTESAEMIPKVSKNVLRPETIESFFYMWRTTGDVKYREWGWTVFQAFQTYSRTPEGAFAAVKDVNVIPVEQEDSMESFWLAETLKYLWLLFGPDELLNLSDWVLNTEAHPLRVSLLQQPHLSRQ